MNFISENREGEYRIQIRDTYSSGKLDLSNGTKVKYCRYINRVGYALDSHSYTKEEWDAEGLKLIAATSGLDKETVQKVINELHLFSPYKGIRRLIYQRLVGSKITDYYRSMWFKDCKETKGIIVGRCRKWTGKYHEGHNYGDWQSGDFGYDPPMLEGINQNLYLVESFNNGAVYMIHPLDLILS